MRCEVLPLATDGSQRPFLRTYLLEGRRRPLVLIFPGGGYRLTSEREAEPIALQFAAAGMHAAVLYYSVPPRTYHQPLVEAARALCFLRDHAESWGILSDKVAVCGFSAGGHLAASLGVHWRQDFMESAPGVMRPKNRPNALILSYPVISTGIHAHRGSFDHLLGMDPDLQGLREMSLERNAHAGIPPTFLWHTQEDPGVPVENSLLFAAALQRHGVPLELHVYPRGPHGFSLAIPETDSGSHGSDPHVAGWMSLCIEWLRETFSWQ